MTFPIKAVFRLTGKLLRQGALPLVLVTVLLYFVPVMAAHFGALFLVGTEWVSFLVPVPGRLGPLALALYTINWFLNAFHMAAVNEIIMRTAAEKPVRPGRLIINALVNTFPVLIIQVALELITGVGAWLLLIPGLFLGAAFSVVVPAYVCEGKGVIEAFRRSFQLTSGRRLPIAIFWLVIGLAIYASVSDFVLPEVTNWLLTPHRWVPAIPGPPYLPPVPRFEEPVRSLARLGRMAFTTALIVLNATIYLTLRFSKADQGDDRIADVFE